MLTEFASSETTVRRFLQEHRAWIGSKLGCPIEEAILFELDFSMVQVAASFLLAGVRLRSDASSATRNCSRLLESVELPPDSYPAFQVHVAREQRGRITERRMVLEAEWQDGPAALWLRGFTRPVVAARIPIVGPSRERDETCECVLVHRECAPRLLQIVRRISARRDSSYLHIFGSGHRKVGRFIWDDLVLSDSVAQPYSQRLRDLSRTRVVVSSPAVAVSPRLLVPWSARQWENQCHPGDVERREARRPLHCTV